MWEIHSISSLLEVITVEENVRTFTELSTSHVTMPNQLRIKLSANSALGSRRNSSNNITILFIRAFLPMIQPALRWLTTRSERTVSNSLKRKDTTMLELRKLLMSSSNRKSSGRFSLQICRFLPFTLLLEVRQSEAC